MHFNPHHNQSAANSLQYPVWKYIRLKNCGVEDFVSTDGVDRAQRPQLTA
jgi:hypothetical protein